MPDIDPPDATMPEGLPEELLSAYRPIEFEGTPLPPFDDEADPDPAIGMEAPVFTGYTIDEKVARVDAKQDGKTMVIMVAHWCPHCNTEVPDILRLQKQGGIPDDLNITAVLTSADPNKQNWPPDEWIRSTGWKFQTVFDGPVNVEVDGQEQLTLGSLGYFGFGGIPSVVLIDEDGIVVDRWSGPKGRDYFEEHIQSALYG